MAHETSINGAVYTITGGSTQVSGAVYDLQKGSTQVSGAVYDLSFSTAAPADTHTLTIQDNSNGSYDLYVRIGDTWYDNSTMAGMTQTLELPDGTEIECAVYVFSEDGMSGIYRNEEPVAENIVGENFYVFRLTGDTEINLAGYMSILRIDITDM